MAAESGKSPGKGSKNKPEKRTAPAGEENSDSESGSDSGDGSGSQSDGEEPSEHSASPVRSNRGDPVDNDDDDWENDESDDFVTKKDMLLESEPTTHHEVHCPHFPGDKFE